MIGLNCKLAMQNYNHNGDRASKLLFGNSSDRTDLYVHLHLMSLLAIGGQLVPVLCDGCIGVIHKRGQCVAPFDRLDYMVYSTGYGLTHGGTPFVAAWEHARVMADICNSSET